MSPETKKVLFMVFTLVVAAALFGGGYATGRYATPTKVVEVEKIVEKQVLVEKIDEKKLVELQEQVRTLGDKLTDVKKTIHKEERTLKHPSGLIETTKVTDVNLSKVVKEQEIKYVDREVKVVETKFIDRVVEVEKVVEKTKVVENQKAQWKATALLGSSLEIQPQLTAPYINPLLTGISVERRIVGPVFMGIWGMTPVQAPLKASFGVSAGIEW